MMDQLLANLKRDVRSLLLSSKLGLGVDQLRRDYVDLLGHELPLKQLGFRNTLHMAQEMPDVVSFCYLADGSLVLKAVTNESTRGIMELVSRQRLPKFNKQRSLSTRPRWTRHPGSRWTPQSGSRGTPQPILLRTRCVLPAHIRAQIRQLLSQGPLRLCELERSFQRFFGRPLCFTDHGFYSLNDLLADVPDLSIQYTRLGSVICLKQPNLPSPSRRVPTGTGSVKPGANQWPAHHSLDPPQLEAELHWKILENSDAGSVSPELKTKLQQRLFGEELPTLQAGFLSATELVAALSDTFHLEPAGGAQNHHWVLRLRSLSPPAECGGEEKEEGTGRRISLYQSTRASLWEQHDDEEEEEADSSGCPRSSSSSSLTTQKCVDLYPVVQVRCSCRLPLDVVRAQRLRAPMRRRPRAMAAVLVERVESPTSFLLRFSKSQEALCLEDMMMEMRRCYLCPEVCERYRLPARYLRRGQVCCLSPQGLWFYRVVLQRVLSPDQVEVYYADFGDRTVVSADKLMFLKSCYAQLPAQAVPAMLTGVQPISGAWSAAATACFRQLCRGRTLVAALHSYHGDVLQLFLCDTHTEDDVYLHTVLQAQGHARPAPVRPHLTRVAPVRPHLTWAAPVRPLHTTTGYVQDSLGLKSLYLDEQLTDLEEEEEDENMTTPTTHQPVTAQCWCKDSRPPGLSELPQSPPPHCTGNHADTRTGPEEEESSTPSVDPGPAVTPDPHRAPETPPSTGPPPIVTPPSLLTPGPAKGCYATHTRAGPGACSSRTSGPLASSRQNPGPLVSEARTLGSQLLSLGARVGRGGCGRTKVTVLRPTEPAVYTTTLWFHTCTSPPHRPGPYIQRPRHR
ncbi:hypothetical protein CRUP_034972 [Coryphaenoides rupestris]|nr:hypothetical protein CRUP_034972 [Coryphaenoides rupestris]